MMLAKFATGVLVITVVGASPAATYEHRPSLRHRGPRPSLLRTTP